MFTRSGLVRSMSQENKRYIIIGIAVLAVIIIAAVWYGVAPAPAPEVAVPTPEAPVPVAEQPPEAPALEAPAGTPAAPQASPISGEGEVVTPSGEPVKLNVEPGSPSAPQQSAPLEKKDIPASAVKITMSPSGISPDTFTAQPGQAITLSVTADESQTHVFKFDDPSLSAVAVGVGPGETRAISFNAPKAGEYVFYCDVPGHRGRGETGKMIVK